MKKPKPIEIDGRTGEGGGQLIRMAVGLAALTTQPIKVTNIRGNRPRNGGLKSQHVTSIQWLAEATEAQVEGLAVGSSTLTFTPTVPPSGLARRTFDISADSGAASTLLILQAILPFCLFAANGGNEPIVLRISGGTNVSFSPSFEYLDQVLLPTLEDRWGVSIGRTLERRAWSLGSQGRGHMCITVQPVPRRQKLEFRPLTRLSAQTQPQEVKVVDVSIVTPASAHSSLQNRLAQDLGDLFPRADVVFKIVEDSGHVARWYTLLVGVSSGGTRWGHDILTSMPKKLKSEDTFVANVSRQVCNGLSEEASLGGLLDQYLQDQVICFQALTNGVSSLPRGGGLDDSEGRMRREKAHEPFGHGSLHAQTARWVVSELLPEVKFFNKGDVVEGVGFSC